jgi:hypothetical protein
MVAGMAEVLGAKDVSPARIRGYVEALSDIPLDHLQAGVRHAIVTWRYPDMPKPADIRAAVDREAQARQQIEATDAPPLRELICTNCEDSGWVVVAERTERAQPPARRCACYRTNPRLVAPKSYGGGEETRRG